MNSLDTTRSDPARVRDALLGEAGSYAAHQYHADELTRT
jgi:hypothetical protein